MNCLKNLVPTRFEVDVLASLHCIKEKDGMIAAEIPLIVEVCNISDHRHNKKLSNTNTLLQSKQIKIFSFIITGYY